MCHISFLVWFDFGVTIRKRGDFVGPCDQNPRALSKHRFLTFSDNVVILYLHNADHADPDGEPPIAEITISNWRMFADALRCRGGWTKRCHRVGWQRHAIEAKSAQAQAQAQFSAQEAHTSRRFARRAVAPLALPRTCRAPMDWMPRTPRWPTSRPILAISSSCNKACATWGAASQGMLRSGATLRRLRTPSGRLSADRISHELLQPVVQPLGA